LSNTFNVVPKREQSELTVNTILDEAKLSSKYLLNQLNR